MSTNQTTKTKRFFWLKLHHDFFNRDEIRIIESQSNGKDYIIFYLKLMLKSINDNGKLLFKDTIPYTPEMLASITNTSIDTVRVAIDAFVKLGLITLLDDGALYMQEVQKLVGSETSDAERMRVKRAAENEQLKLSHTTKQGTIPEQCSNNITLENKSKETKSIENKSSYNLPSPNNFNQGGRDRWHKIVMQSNLQFTITEINAIEQWFVYKIGNNKSLTTCQIELTLKSLAQHKQLNYDIVYMLNQSIIGGYGKIMDPTKACIAKPPAKEVNSKYQAKDYIIPRSEIDKKELWHYLRGCYHNKIDPRTGIAMTKEQISHIARHFKSGLSQDINQDKYIYLHEVEKGISLFDQPLTIV